MTDDEVGQVALAQRLAENVQRVGDHGLVGGRRVARIGGDIVDLVGEPGEVDARGQQAPPEIGIAGTMLRGCLGILRVSVSVRIFGRQRRERCERVHSQRRIFERPEPPVEAEAKAIDEARDVERGVELKAIGAGHAVPHRVEEHETAIGGRLHVVDRIADVDRLVLLPALVSQDEGGRIRARLVRHAVLPADEIADRS